MSDGRQLLDVKETAARLRVSRTTIYELFASGALRSVHIGTRRLVRPDDLDAFIEAQTK